MKTSTDDMVGYLSELGSALLAASCPAHRLEELINTAAHVEGFSAHTFAMPTGLLLSVRAADGTNATTMLRAHQWRNDLGLLAAIDDIANAVAHQELTMAEARAQLAALGTRAPEWPRWAQLLAVCGSSGGAAVFLGGTFSDFLLAALGAFALRVVMLAAKRVPDARFLEPFIGGIVASSLAWLVTLQSPRHSREVLVLAILLPLLPGMSLATGLQELVHKHLVSGTARLMDAAVTILSIVFGIALVVAFEGWLHMHPSPVEPAASTSWLLQVLAMGVVSVSFGIVFGLPRQQLWLSLFSCAISWSATLLLRDVPGGPAAFIASLLLALAANTYARFSLRPAQLFLLPGLLLLVPGAFGFRSLEALLRGDFEVGATRFADMMLTGGGVVMGLLVATVLMPPRKIL